MAKAVQHRIAYSLRNQENAVSVMLVNIFVSGLTVAETDGEANKTPPGWGFFLVECMEHVGRDTNRTRHPVIDLCLYQ